MIVVIFELEPEPEEKDTYFEMASALRPLLEEIDGFISIERFQSVASPGRFLSPSFWRDEDAVSEWRSRDLHRMAQKRGRRDVFIDYRLRIALVQRDYGMNSRQEAPSDSKKLYG
ncbi:MAG: antibiotic biosynthesis monooxygenase [Arenicella sp.]|nr:antibiotic biosynthesis monooxygenase [Arenicella sp.]